MTKRYVGRSWARSAETTEIRFPSVAEAGGRQPHLELGSGELRMAAAARRAAHVDDKLHPRLLEEPDQLLLARSAVPDRE